jgi:hypothetical protein
MTRVVGLDVGPDHLMRGWMMTRVEGLAVDPGMFIGTQVGGPGLHLLVPVFWIYIIAFAPHPSRLRGAPHPSRAGRG